MNPSSCAHASELPGLVLARERGNCWEGGFLAQRHLQKVGALEPDPVCPPTLTTLTLGILEGAYTENRSAGTPTV